MSDERIDLRKAVMRAADIVDCHSEADLRRVAESIKEMNAATKMWLKVCYAQRLDEIREKRRASDGKTANQSGGDSSSSGSSGGSSSEGEGEAQTE